MLKNRYTFDHQFSNSTKKDISIACEINDSTSRNVRIVWSSIYKRCFDDS